MLVDAVGGLGDADAGEVGAEELHCSFHSFRVRVSIRVS